MNAKRLGFLLVSGVAVSFVFTAVFMKFPALWFLMPAFIDDAMILFFKVKTQEEASAFEFFSAWLLSFLLLLFVAAAAAVVMRWSQPGRVD
jgi:hypothetical protein